MGNDIKSQEGAIKHVVNYYAYFKYAPSLEELYLFYPYKITQSKLEDILQGSIKKGKIIQKNQRYTLRGHSILFRLLTSKKKTSDRKIQSISLYLWVVSKIPSVLLVGLSGSIAMYDADPDDDIDLFIITKQNRLWTTRFWCIFFASLFGVRRKRNSKNASNKVCLNLFFDEREIIMPINKQNEYIAHEILQMKPVYIKGDIYNRFLDANKWIYSFFPNAESLSLQGTERRSNLNSNVIPVMEVSKVVIPAKAGIYINRFPVLTSLGYVRRGKLGMTINNFMEVLLKRFQLHIINRHKTTEIITSTQLWFFPEDFEKKLKKIRLIK